MIRFRKEKGYSTAPYSVNISLTEKCPLYSGSVVKTKI